MSNNHKIIRFLNDNDNKSIQDAVEWVGSRLHCTRCRSTGSVKPLRRDNGTYGWACGNQGDVKGCGYNLDQTTVLGVLFNSPNPQDLGKMMAKPLKNRVRRISIKFAEDSGNTSQWTRNDQKKVPSGKIVDICANVSHLFS